MRKIKSLEKVSLQHFQFRSSQVLIRPDCIFPTISPRRKALPSGRTEDNSVSGAESLSSLDNSVVLAKSLRQYVGRLEQRMEQRPALRVKTRRQKLILPKRAQVETEIDKYLIPLNQQALLREIEERQREKQREAEVMKMEQKQEDEAPPQRKEDSRLQYSSGQLSKMLEGLRQIYLEFTRTRAFQKRLGSFTPRIPEECLKVLRLVEGPNPGERARGLVREDELPKWINYLRVQMLKEIESDFRNHSSESVISGLPSLQMKNIPLSRLYADLRSFIASHQRSIRQTTRFETRLRQIEQQHGEVKVGKHLLWMASKIDQIQEVILGRG